MPSRFLRFFKFFVMAAVAVSALGGGVMLLWNWLVPGLVAGAQPIDFPHALGLLLLARVLSGGFGHRGWLHRRAHWAKMSDEERQRFRAAMGHCRHGHHRDRGPFGGPAASGPGAEGPGEAAAAAQ